MDEQLETDILIQASQQCEEIMKKAESTTSMKQTYLDDFWIEVSQECERIMNEKAECSETDNTTIPDELLIQASQQWQAEQRRFSIPVTSEAVESAIVSGVPQRE